MKCCNNNCNQGRNCPHNALSISDVTFTVVIGIITLIAGVMICWWLITAVMMIVEAIK